MLQWPLAWTRDRLDENGSLDSLIAKTFALKSQKSWHEFPVPGDDTDDIGRCRRWLRKPRRVAALAGESWIQTVACTAAAGKAPWIFGSGCFAGVSFQAASKFMRVRRWIAHCAIVVSSTTYSLPHIRLSCFASARKDRHSVTQQKSDRVPDSSDEDPSSQKPCG